VEEFIDKRGEFENDENSEKARSMIEEAYPFVKEAKEIRIKDKDLKIGTNKEHYNELMTKANDIYKEASKLVMEAVLAESDKESVLIHH